MNPWDELPHVWKTEAAYLSWLRGQLRRIWSRHPIKNEFIRRHRRSVDGRRHKWELQCKQCEGWFQAKHIEVDHISPAGSFRCIEDFRTFGYRLIHISMDELQILCKRCHKVKTYAERMSLSLEESESQIEANAMMRLPAGSLRALMLKHGASNEDVKNHNARKQWVMEFQRKRQHGKQQKA